MNFPLKTKFWLIIRVRILLLYIVEDNIKTNVIPLLFASVIPLFGSLTDEKSVVFVASLRWLYTVCKPIVCVFAFYALFSFYEFYIPKYKVYTCWVKFPLLR